MGGKQMWGTSAHNEEVVQYSGTIVGVHFTSFNFWLAALENPYRPLSTGAPSNHPPSLYGETTPGQ